MAEQMKSLKRCYNCGREFTDDNKETVENTFQCKHCMLGILQNIKLIG